MPSNKYKKIKKKVVALVKKSCYDQNNYFQGRTWGCHILPVVEQALHLGRMLKADLEVLELAAYLHDIANISDIKYEKRHHLVGAKMARDILSEFGCPENKIKAVEYCILVHRGSVKMKRKTLEAKILASADAMSHFTELMEMFYLAFRIRGLNSKDGVYWLKEKLERDWNKIIKSGRELIKKDYYVAMYLLNHKIR